MQKLIKEAVGSPINKTLWIIDTFLLIGGIILDNRVFILAVIVFIAVLILTLHQVLQENDVLKHPPVDFKITDEEETSARNFRYADPQGALVKVAKVDIDSRFTIHNTRNEPTTITFTIVDIDKAIPIADKEYKFIVVREREASNPNTLQIVKAGAGERIPIRFSIALSIDLQSDIEQLRKIANVDSFSITLEATQGDKSENPFRFELKNSNPGKLFAREIEQHARDKGAHNLIDYLKILWKV